MLSQFFGLMLSRIALLQMAGILHNTSTSNQRGSTLVESKSLENRVFSSERCGGLPYLFFEFVQASFEQGFGPRLPLPLLRASYFHFN